MIGQNTRATYKEITKMETSWWRNTVSQTHKLSQSKFHC